MTFETVRSQDPDDFFAGDPEREFDVDLYEEFENNQLVFAFRLYRILTFQQYKDKYVFWHVMRNKLYKTQVTNIKNIKWRYVQ